jgi:diacylglycerol kinase (ATP)
MTLLLVLNPGSRGGRGRRLWTRWTVGLARAGAPFRTAETRSLADARDIARTAAGVHTVVAVGGDGTINAVLTGLAETPAPRPRMGVLYAGTSPDFCRFHGIPTEPGAALSVLLEGRTRAVDAATIRYQGPDGPACACFGCSCNIGLGAAVAGAANRFRRLLGDRAGTALAVLGAVAAARPMALALDIDGEAVRLAPVNHLAILKNPWIASGLRLDVGRTPDDGLLSVVAVTGRTRAGLCRLLPGFYSGAALRAPGLFVRRATRVAVRADQDVDMEFDGDPRGRLPVEIAVQPRVVELITRHE